MREIKFRGRDEHGEWVHGSLIVCEDGHCVINWVDRLRHVSTDIGVDPETVGQFTGLKDSTGKEIYEGDILRDPDGRTLEVVWNNGAGSWECVRENYHFLFIMRYIDTMTVIGNVHDNPDLLEATE